MIKNILELKNCLEKVYSADALDHIDAIVEAVEFMYNYTGESIPLRTALVNAGLDVKKIDINPIIQIEPFKEKYTAYNNGVDDESFYQRALNSLLSLGLLLQFNYKNAKWDKEEGLWHR